MIQDIYPHRLHNEFIPHRALDGEGIGFAFDGPKVLCRFEGNAVRLPRVKELGEEKAWRFLFTLDETPCYLLEAALDAPEGWEYEVVKALRHRAEGPREGIFAAWTAFQLANWYRDNRFCGRCGGPTHPADDERAMVCDRCKRRIYPRIIPAVIVGVTHGDEILMTKYNGRDIPYYALVAGFTEIGLCGQNAVWRFYGGDGGAYGKGTLLINGSGKLWDNYYYYTPIGWLTEERGEDRSFSGQNIQAGEVKRVIIEDGITSIGESDFEGFTSLASITFRGPAPAISSGHGVTRNIRIYYPDYEPSWNNVDRTLFPSGCKWISQDADGVHHHKWGSSTVTKKATCTEDGEQEGVCSECGEKATEVIPATGHKWATKYTVDKAATCAEEGVESIHCTVCGSIREGSERTLEKTAHSYGSWQVVTAASCEQSGLRKKVCKSCGDTVTEEIPATGHKWATEYTVDKKPTKTEEGIESIHCTVCDAIKEGSERTIPPQAQEPQDLRIDPAAYTVVMGKTVDVTVTGAKGALTCEAEDPSMATATVSGPKITVKGVKTGTVKLIVKAAETADYEAGEAEFELNVVPGKTTRGDMFNLANNVKVTWLAVPGAKYYKVYRTGVTNPKESLSEPVIVTTGLVGWDKSPGLTNGNAYRYKIVASTTGAGDPSGDSPLSYSKLMYRLKTVVIRSVKNTAPGKVTVKYDRSASGDSYVLQYCERQDMVGAKTKVVLGANNTSYVIGGLKKGKTYYISIRVRKKVNGIDYYTTFGVAKKIKITQ